MKTITTNFLLFIMFFLNQCSLSSMQKSGGPYEKFLEQRKEQENYEQPNDSNVFFYSKEELEGDLVLETTVSVVVNKLEERLRGKKQILNSNLNGDDADIAQIEYLVNDKKLPEQC